jgi:hypothetical protein
MIPKENVRLHKLFNAMFVWWKICWTFLTPLLLIGLTIFSWIGMGRLSVGDYVFPWWTELVGNFLSASSLFGILFWAIYEVYKVKKYNLVS